MSSLNSNTNLKRKRDPVFQPAEKARLIDLVQDSFDIVESKKTDAISSRKKTEQSMNIGRQFNVTASFMTREWTVLKNLWENLKKKAKASPTEQRQDVFRTGGGPPRRFNDDPILERVITLIRPNVDGFMHGLNGEIAENINVYEESGDNYAEKRNDETEMPEINITLHAPDKDWSQYNPAMLKTRRSRALNQRRENTTLTVVNPELLGEEEDKIDSSRPNESSMTSRRRPILKQALTDVLAEAKVNTLNLSNEQATEQHEISMRIFRLQEQQEEEKIEQEVERTEQEKLKTAILREQLRKAKEN